VTASLCDRLRAECAGVWESLHEHPFVAGLADGTLPPDTFRFYVEQNLQYLPEYARAMALAASRAEDVDTMRIFSADLANIVDVEIPENRVLRERVIELGARDLGGSDGMAPANVAYTGFLVSTASTSRPVEVMAAIVPCAWSYGDIARRRADAIADHPVYAEWVRFFASDSYEDLLERMRDDFERLVAQDEVPFKRLSELFTTAVRLERGFWDMAQELAHWPDVRARYPLA
jgi:thiaminase/transcriptional activator TenA